MVRWFPKTGNENISRLSYFCGRAVLLSLFFPQLIQRLCKSVFPKKDRDYTVNQAIWTLLYKEKSPPKVLELSFSVGITINHKVRLETFEK